MIGTLNNTSSFMKENNLKFKKKFGQNFLIDKNILNNICIESDITKEDFIIEIGPGIGALTEYLCKYAGKVLSIEIDKTLVEPLKENLKEYSNFNLINDDFLKLDLKEIIEQYAENKNVKIVANLPYYITTPIITKILESQTNIDTLTIMVQKEVADRLVAKEGTKEYGAIGLFVNYHSNLEKLFDVSPKCFLPQPKVYSSVIKLTVKTKKEKMKELVNCNINNGERFDDLTELEEKLLFNIIKSVFSSRRKTFLNSVGLNNYCGFDKEKFMVALKKINKDENVRGEKLTLLEFMIITKIVNNL